MERKSRKEWLISDDEDEVNHPVIIYTDPDSDSETSEPEQSKLPKMKPVMTLNTFVSMDDVEENWWTKLKKEIPEEQQCKVQNCSFAPPGHKRHSLFDRSFGLHEMRLIIQYLIYYDELCYAKGLRVWERMHARGYMCHRTVESLRNNFKRILLRDIKLFKLPKDWEDRFLEMIP